MKFKPKPFILRILTPENFWVTFHPYIYHPMYVGRDFLDSPDLFNKPIIQHEKTHYIQQETTGRFLWLFKYFCSRKFRMGQEIAALIQELKFRSFERRSYYIMRFAASLASLDYFWCASFSKALTEIKYQAMLSGVEYPDI